jgi:hypothetical protein
LGDNTGGGGGRCCDRSGTSVSEFGFRLDSFVQCDHKLAAHLMSTIQKVTSNVHSVPRQSPDI